MKKTLTGLERESNPCKSSENQHTAHQLLHKKVILSVLSLLLLFIGVGCTHQMNVKNLKDYYVSPTNTGNSFDVALTPYSGNAELRPFYRETVDALNRHPSVRMVRGNWTSNGNPDDFNPDYVVKMNIFSRYEGSGWNFPITFPGFLLFIGAANGYVYKADVTTDISVSSLSERTDSSFESGADIATQAPAGSIESADSPSESSAEVEIDAAVASSSESIDSPSESGVNIETKTEVASSSEGTDSHSESCTEVEICRDTVHMNFDLRHCDFNRGFWSGSGWWMPGWGLHNIITGIVFVGYDPDATEPFVEKSDDTFGEYIAEKIVSMIAKEQQGIEKSTLLSQE